VGTPRATLDRQNKRLQLSNYKDNKQSGITPKNLALQLSNQTRESALNTQNIQGFLENNVEVDRLDTDLLAQSLDKKFAELASMSKSPTARQINQTKQMESGIEQQELHANLT